MKIKDTKIDKDRSGTKQNREGKSKDKNNRNKNECTERVHRNKIFENVLKKIKHIRKPTKKKTGKSIDKGKKIRKKE